MREDTEGGCDIYRASYVSGEIFDVERIPNNLNSEKWDSQPSITCDGKVLFFSSTREGGYGGSDIYFSKLEDDGTWSYAENLGPLINSAGDEEAPFISSDGKTLYFTSTGLPGMGDGDLFLSRWMNKSWSSPINLGFPINSQGKELGIYIQADGQTINFSSAREGGRGGLDLYQTTLPSSMRPESVVHVEGFVKDDETGLPLSTEVKISRAGQEITLTSDKNGRFFICLAANQAFSFQAQPEGYTYYISAEFFESRDNRQSHEVELRLSKGDTYVVPEFKQTREIKERRVQLFFGYDSAEISSNTEEDLKGILKILGEEDWWKVEVIGYADNSGSSSYNLLLSEKRAGMVVQFLEANGVKTDQVLKQQGQGSVQGDSKMARRVDVRLYR